MHAGDDQAETLALLARPETFGVAGPVERIDTHCAAVFLAGERAYKLKRAVRFPYLDFSTVALRKVVCDAELALNRRTAPELYLAVVPVIRRADGNLALGTGEGLFGLVGIHGGYQQQFHIGSHCSKFASKHHDAPELATGGDGT